MRHVPSFLFLLFTLLFLDPVAGPVAGADELPARLVLDRARSYLQKMQTTLKRDDQRKAQAMQQHDLIKANCLGEKLSQGQAHLAAAQQSLSALSDAIAGHDAVERDHHAGRVRLLYQKVVMLSAEADRCAGEDGTYVGPSRIEVEVDFNAHQGDPTDPGLPAPTSTLAPSGVEEALPDSVFARPPSAKMSPSPAGKAAHGHDPGERAKF